MRRTILLAVVFSTINAFTTPFIIQSNHNIVGSVGGGVLRGQQQLYLTTQQQLTNIENLPTDLPDSLSDAASIAANVCCYIIIILLCLLCVLYAYRGRGYREGG